MLPLVKIPKMERGPKGCSVKYKTHWVYDFLKGFECDKLYYFYWDLVEYFCILVLRELIVFVVCVLCWLCNGMDIQTCYVYLVVMKTF